MKKKLMKEIIRTGRSMSKKTRQQFINEFPDVNKAGWEGDEAIATAHMAACLLITHLNNIPYAMQRKSLSILTCISFPDIVFGNTHIDDCIIYRLRDSLSAMYALGLRVPLKNQE